MAFAQDNRSPVIRQIPGAVTGIGASQIAVVKIPTGATDGEISIECTAAGTGLTRAQVESMLTQWRLVLSGVEKFSISGKDLCAITEFYRTTAIGDTGYVVIPLERLWMSELAGKFNPMYGTVGETSLQIEITQDATSTCDAIKAWVRIANSVETLGSHIRLVKLQPNIGSTGVYSYLDLPKNPNELLVALHLAVPVVANLTNIAYIADNVRLVDTTPGLLNTLYRLTDPNRTPQTAKLYVHLDFTNRGIFGDAVPLTMAQQILELTFANAAPNGISVIAELMTPEPKAA